MLMEIRDEIIINILITEGSLKKILALEAEDGYDLFWSFYNYLFFSLQD